MLPADVPPKGRCPQPTAPRAWRNPGRVAGYRNPARSDRSLGNLLRIAFRQVVMMDGEHACLGILDVMTQRCADRAERQFVPGNVFQAEKSCLDAFWPGIQGHARDRRKVKEMYLLGLGNVDDGV